jgi:hypothetical protein
MAADLHFELHRAATFRITALGRRPIEAHADYRQTRVAGDPDFSPVKVD